jgi:DNA-binding MarR family transcriptional regulator
MSAVSDGPTSSGRTWTLLSNHGRLLLLIASDPSIRLRDMAVAAGITERAAGSIVSDLEDAGYITRTRVGRRNTYVLHTDRPFRHQAEAGHTVGELVALFHEGD